MTDAKGAFTLSGVQRDAILRVSYLGYEAREVAVAGQTQIKITLKEEASSSVTSSSWAMARRRKLTYLVP